MNDDLKHHVCFNQGTEPPFTGKYVDHKEVGTYTCTMCNTPLFKSNTKFDSGTGWPSFYDAITNNIGSKTDISHGMTRTEVHCNNCKAHLGHVFPDGPPPTGQRFCINSISLNFLKND
ncbi:MAG: peptide-methionine (R)-S-oxide reductase MsrB [Candidatus Marinamargulisbacteria bacterium]